MNKIEGTLILDGLLEGRLPALPQAVEKLRAWVTFAAETGLDFVLQIDGTRFSLLAANKPISSKRFAPSPPEVISSAVNEMLKTIPPGERGGISSTLRSTEWRPRQEIQTLYPINSEGVIEVRQRTLEAATQAPPPPLTLRERMRMGLFTLVAVIAVLALSAVFVDYRGLWREIKEDAAAPSADQIEIDNTTFANYFTVEKKEVSPGGKSLRLLLRRTGKFPRSSADIAAASTAPTTQPIEHRLTLDSLARGYIRAEYYADRGAFQSFTQPRIQPLRDLETLELLLPLSPQATPKRIVLTN